MTPSFTVKVSQKQILDGLKQTVIPVLNAALNNSSADVYNELQKLIKNLLMGSPEFHSLQGGLLKTDFGLDDSDTPLRDILLTLQKSLDVKPTPVSFVGNRLTGGLKIRMIQADFQDLLDLPSVKYSSNGLTVDWLRWLLAEGDRVILSNYHVAYHLDPSQRRSSRTGVAIMQYGLGYRVPPEYAGDLNSNWIVRTFDFAAIEKLIGGIVQKAIERRIK